MSLPWDWPKPLGADAERWENPDIPADIPIWRNSSPTTAYSPRRRPVRFPKSVSASKAGVRACCSLKPYTAADRTRRPVPTRRRAKTSSAAIDCFSANRRRPNSPRGKCPFQELGRAKPINRDHAEGEGLTCALIADPRNDAHAAIAQLTTLFHQLHNKIAQTVESAGLVAGGLAADIRNYRVYLLSRAICVRVYRRLLREDLLPRILHPAIVAAYDRDGATFLDTQSPDELPTEFAHAFRFGHAMVRPNYVFNDLNVYGEDLADMMLATSGARPWRMPLDDSWMAQWSRFFPIGTDRPNLSRRIAPSLSGGLFSGESLRAHRRDRERGPRLQGPPEQRFHSAMVGAGAGRRDLLAERPELAGLSPLLSDRTERERQIGDWLGRHRLASGLNDEDRDFLAADPPLVLLCPVRGRARDGGPAPRRPGLADPGRDVLSRTGRRCGRERATGGWRLCL